VRALTGSLFYVSCVDWCSSLVGFATTSETIAGQELFCRIRMINWKSRLTTRVPNNLWDVKGAQSRYFE